MKETIFITFIPLHFPLFPLLKGIKNYMLRGGHLAGILAALGGDPLRARLVGRAGKNFKTKGL